MIVLRNDPARSGLLALPNTFAGLMDLYERNYINIRRLVPAMPPAGAHQISSLPGGLDLHLEVIERCRYTSELCLTYYFQKNAAKVAEPDLHVRVYHDARLAEVVSAHLRRGPCSHERTSQSHLSSRWHINRFLYKWLNYCLHQGHRFEG